MGGETCRVGGGCGGGCCINCQTSELEWPGASTEYTVVMGRSL